MFTMVSRAFFPRPHRAVVARPLVLDPLPRSYKLVRLLPLNLAQPRHDPVLLLLETLKLLSLASLERRKCLFCFGQFRPRRLSSARISALPS